MVRAATICWPYQIVERLLLVSILKWPRWPPQSAPFLSTFSSVRLRVASLPDLSHEELFKGAAFVVGLPQSFTLQEGSGKLVWQGATKKLVEVQYGACKFANPALKAGL